MTNPISIIQNSDCVEAMKQYPDNFFDLAVVDPPYGIDAVNKVYKNKGAYVNPNEKYGVPKSSYEMKDWDKSIPNADYFNELFRVSKNQIIWGANHYVEHLYNSRGWIFWDKDNYSDFSDGELAWTSFDKQMKRVLYVWNGMRQGKSVGNKSCKGGNWATGNKDNLEKRIHPTQKPVKLYEWILENYANQGDKILDTHLGSGSSRIAAHKMGFDFYGFETDKDYFDESQIRFEKAIAMPLFDAKVEKYEEVMLF